MSSTDQSAAQRSRRKEAILTTLVGWVPLSPGFTLRQKLYRGIFARMGAPVFIRPGAEFVQTDCIEVGDRVSIQRGARVDSKGRNTKIVLANWVHLDRGVDIRTTGDNCHIEIGEHTAVNPYSCIHGPGSIKIGKDCLIASHVGIYANNHIFADPDRPIREQGLTCKGIVIEDDCWLGSGVKVLDGVTIGRGSVIGAGAVVTKDIPPYSVAVGVPAKVVAQRGNQSTLSPEAQAAIAAEVRPLNSEVSVESLSR